MTTNVVAKDKIETLVATSFNPHGNIHYQAVCFSAWRDRGYLVKSFNSAGEIELLLEYGIESSDIVEISEEETSLLLFGKAIPRILPVLMRSADFDVGYVILVNSDIYPGHTGVVSYYLSEIADIIAMTRSDFIGQPRSGHLADTHYRGGLDIFFFTARGLRNVLDNLVDQNVATRMTFGVPGWDFFLGHEILHRHSGVIMDGAVMFHQHHKTSYCDIQEFDSYADHLCKSGVYENSSGIALVEEFSASIRAHCVDNEKLSRILKERYFETVRLDLEDSSSLKRKSLVHAELLKIAGKYSINLECFGDSLGHIISNQLSGEYWEGAVFCRNTELMNMPDMQGYLFLLLTTMLVKGSGNESRLTMQYPAGNLHNGVLEKTIRDYSDSAGLESEVLKLFSSELVDYSIFNMELFKYIALSSCSNELVGLYKGVALLCQEGLKNSIYYQDNKSISLFIGGGEGFESNIINSDTPYYIWRKNRSMFVEWVEIAVSQAIIRLTDGGIEGICAALSTLVMLRNKLQTNPAGRYPPSACFYPSIRETVEHKIQEKKHDLLKMDLNKHA